jgi:CheY-like chemotaxis protein
MQNNIEHVLVVDDSLDNQMLLSLLLTSKGYRVSTVSNGREDLNLLSEMVTAPDLILLDAQMPIMDGYQFRSEQTNNRKIKDIPVIVMTASDEALTRSKMLDPYQVMIKPLNCNEIVKVISSIQSM